MVFFAMAQHVLKVNFQMVGIKANNIQGAIQNLVGEPFIPGNTDMEGTEIPSLHSCALLKRLKPLITVNLPMSPLSSQSIIFFLFFIIIFL